MHLQTVPNLTLANVYHNADVLGFHRITYAESLEFTHEYDVQLKEATTQKKRYLLLKELVDRKLIKTKICKKTVRAIAHNCTSMRELITLRYSVAFSEEMIRIVQEAESNFSFNENMENVF